MDGRYAGVSGTLALHVTIGRRGVRADVFRGGVRVTSVRTRKAIERLPGRWPTGVGWLAVTPVGEDLLVTLRMDRLVGRLPPRCELVFPVGRITSSCP
ncbi:hypothetical protein ACIBG8_43540 [Nonomuraea sp. NPDC050556]|uniref:hypothetical protein n=1 Tax=Nonomuraea sp. NPDC050556 TaxID=3364369 RepID=UPI0037A27974